MTDERSTKEYNTDDAEAIDTAEQILNDYLSAFEEMAK